MTICYIDQVVSELFGRNFNSQFVRYGSWFEVFLYLNIGDGGWGSIENIIAYLQITFAVRGPFESKILIHYSGCWGQLSKQGTYTFNVDVWVDLP